MLKRILWYIRGHFIWHHRDYWAEHYSYTGVHKDDMPNKYISKWEFWVKHSPMNSC
jgi:hypothetical protein